MGGLVKRVSNFKRVPLRKQHLCKCGHRRGSHITPSDLPDYPGMELGQCSEVNCKCMEFRKS